MKSYLIKGNNGKSVTYPARLATIQEAASLAPKYLHQMHGANIKPVSVEEVYPGTEHKVRNGEVAHFDWRGGVEFSGIVKPAMKPGRERRRTTPAADAAPALVAEPEKPPRKPANRGAKAQSGVKPETDAAKAKRRRGSARRNEPTAPANVEAQGAGATA